MTPPQLIGLCGRKGSGKSTAGRILCDTHAYTELAFADPLKRGIQEMFGLQADQMWGERKDILDSQWGVTPRQLLQFIGTEVVREALPRMYGWTDGHTSPWVFRMEQAMRTRWEADPTCRIVITDVRFADEAELVRRYGGVIWRVDRGDPDEDPVHVSEQAVGVIPDDLVRNDGTLAELAETIDRRFRETCARPRNDGSIRGGRS